MKSCSGKDRTLKKPGGDLGGLGSGLGRRCAESDRAESRDRNIGRGERGKSQCGQMTVKAPCPEKRKNPSRGERGARRRYTPLRGRVR